MPSIGFIDDRLELREELAQAIRRVLPEGWNIIASSPLPNLSTYPSWLSENEIVALILDELLNEVPEEDENAENYFGHDLVVFLRSRFPTLPIFIVTAVPNSEEIQNRFKDVEDIIHRRDFGTKAGDYVPRVIRASQQYLEVFERDLAVLSNYAQRIAIGEDVSDRESQEALAIQTKIETSFPLEEMKTRSEWLSELQNLMGELNLLQSEVEEFLQGVDDEVEKDS